MKKSNPLIEKIDGFIEFNVHKFLFQINDCYVYQILYRLAAFTV